MLPGPAVLGCCLVSFHFLWAILCPQAVQAVILDTNGSKTVKLSHKLLAVTGQIPKFPFFLGASRLTGVVVGKGGSGYAAKQNWLMAHYHTLAMA